MNDEGKTESLYDPRMTAFQTGPATSFVTAISDLHSAAPDGGEAKFRHVRALASLRPGVSFLQPR